MDSKPTSVVSQYNLALPIEQVRELATQWLREDCAGFDAGAVAAGAQECTATLYAKDELMVAGTLFFETVFEQLPPCTVDWHHTDGTFIEHRPSSQDKMKVPVATVRGPAHLVLRGERAALNAMAECSAVATISHKLMQTVRANSTTIQVAGTRKTTPGLRLLQKYGMIVGGVDPHRYDLSSMTMIKDNHIMAAGDIRTAVRNVRKIGGFSLKVDVEAESEEQAMEAASAGADIIMLDNFEPNELERVAGVVKQKFPNIVIEASGGISLDSIAKFCVPNVDVISMSVNRHAKMVDMSLKINAG